MGTMFQAKEVPLTSPEEYAKMIENHIQLEGPIRPVELLDMLYKIKKDTWAPLDELSLDICRILGVKVEWDNTNRRRGGDTFIIRFLHDGQKVIVNGGYYRDFIHNEAL